MRRILSTFLAALSVVLCAAICVLWLRSHFVRDYAWAFLPWTADAQGGRLLKVDADSGGGQIEVAWRVWTAAQREQLRQRAGIAAFDTYHRTFAEVPRQYARSDPATAWNALGFKTYSGPTHSSVSVPYWAAAMLSAFPAAFWAVARWRRRRRGQAGLCRNCGYDLRATPERCPECGSVAAPAS